MKGRPEDSIGFEPHELVEMQRRALRGDPAAQTNLGIIYQKGWYVEKNKKLAIEWFRLAAEQGNAFAKDSLGTMLENSSGAEGGDKNLIEWQQIAVAQNNLGEKYRFGRGVKIDNQKAIEWFRLAADQGNIKALLHLGVMNKFDEGKAAYLLRKAASGMIGTIDIAKEFSAMTKDPTALYHFTMIIGDKRLSNLIKSNANQFCQYLKNDTIVDDKERYECAKILFENHLKYLARKKLYENRQLLGENLIFVCNQIISHEPKDSELAKKAEMLKQKQEASDKLNQLRKAARVGNNPDAAYELANLYRDGKSGFQQSNELAAKWYWTAVKLGYQPAEAELKKVIIDASSSLLAELESDKIDEASRKILRDIVGEVYRDRWKLYITEKWKPVDKHDSFDYQEFKEYYGYLLKAATLGNNASAQGGLASNSYFGIKRTIYAGTAAERVEVVFKKNYKAAFKWAQKSSAQGYALGQYIMGCLYFTGSGVEKDYKLAHTYYDQAAKQGYARAQNALGEMYMHGLGVDQDYAKAFELYDLAARQGYEPARVNIDDMYEKNLIKHKRDNKAVNTGINRKQEHSALYETPPPSPPRTSKIIPSAPPAPEGMIDKDDHSPSPEQQRSLVAHSFFKSENISTDDLPPPPAYEDALNMSMFPPPPSYDQVVKSELPPPPPYDQVVVEDLNKIFEEEDRNDERLRAEKEKPSSPKSQLQANSLMKREEKKKESKAEEHVVKAKKRMKE